MSSGKFRSLYQQCQLPDLFLNFQGSPLPILLDDEMASLVDLGIGNESTILVDEES